MGLPRKTPLRSNLDHDWQRLEKHPGQLECRRCGARVTAHTTEVSLPSAPCPGMRRGKVRPVSRARTRKKKDVDAFGGVSDLMRGSGCLVYGQRVRPGDECFGDGDPAHVGARGMGGGRGDWVPEAYREDNAPPDVDLPEPGQLVLLQDGVWRWSKTELAWVPVRNAVVNLCRGHHIEFDTEMGGNPKRFLEKYGVNLVDRARAIGIEYVRSLSVD